MGKGKKFKRPSKIVRQNWDNIREVLDYVENDDLNKRLKKLKLV